MFTIKPPFREDAKKKKKKKVLHVIKCPTLHRHGMNQALFILKSLVDGNYSAA